MAKFSKFGRVVHKEIHDNEQLADLDINCRYLYISMIVHADDHGRMKASPKSLKALIFPFDETIRISSIKDWRDKLSATGLIQLYAVDGQEYLAHPNWEKWQPLRKDRVKDSEYPLPSYGCQLVDILPPNTTQHNLTQPKEKQPNLTESKGRFTPPLLQEVKYYCEERKNTVNVDKFHAFYESKGWMVGKNKMKDWKAAVRNWEGEKSNQPVITEVPIVVYKKNTQADETKEYLERMKQWELESKAV